MLYDQRGTLYSQPALLCPEELNQTLSTIEEDLSPDEEAKQAEQAALECRQRLVQSGVNLAAYNSFENALDIEDLRRGIRLRQVRLLRHFVRDALGAAGDARDAQYISQRGVGRCRAAANQPQRDCRRIAKPGV